MIGAVDIGGTKIAVGLVDESGQLAASTSLPTRPHQDYSESLAEVIRVLERLAQEYESVLHGIGIGTTGRLNPDGSLQPNQFLPTWSNQHPSKDISNHFGITTAIENDADAAALAEYQWGAGCGVKSLIYVTVGTGIGGGIILDGKLYRGVDGCHPELGHHVVDPSGPPCFCGANGCWERMASGTALAEWARKHGGDPEWDARMVCDLAEQGNQVATRAVSQVAYYLGIGLANLITNFTPDMITLGGGLMQRWDLFQAQAEQVIQQHCGLVPWQKTRLVPSQLEHPGLAGAAAVWFHRS
jgi:glucokinase